MWFVSILFAVAILAPLIGHDYARGTETASGVMLILIIYSAIIHDKPLLLFTAILLPVYRIIQPLTQRPYLRSGGILQMLQSLAYPLVYLTIPIIIGYYFTTYRFIGFDQWAVGFYTVLAVSLGMAATVNPRTRSFMLSEKLAFPSMRGMMRFLILLYWILIPIIIVESVICLGSMGLVMVIALAGEYLVWRSASREVYRLASLLFYPVVLMIVSMIYG